MPQAIAAAAAAVITVLTPIFGAGTAGAIAGALVSSTALRIGTVLLLNTLTSKLFGLELDSFQSGMSSKQVMTRGALEPRKIVYGQAAVSGPIVYSNLSGSNGEYLWYQIALCQGESDSIVSVWLDGDEIPVADIAWTAGTGGADGTGTAEVSTAKFVGDNSTAALRIYFGLGHPDQVVNNDLNVAFSDISLSHRLRNVTWVMASLLYNADTENVWKGGAPSNILAVAKGRKIYDPRLDTSNNLGAVNLVTNGDYSNWIDAATSSTENPRTGAYHCVVASGAGGPNARSEQFSVSAGQVVKGSAWIARNESDLPDNSCSLAVRFLDSGGATLARTTLASVPTSTSGYTFFSGQATAPASTVSAQIDIGESTGVGEYFFDDVFAVIDGSAGDTGGAGTHRYTDSTTWEWSDNPALCIADYLTQIMDVAPATGINWASIAAAADDCDASVAIPTAATETRFTCNGVLSLADTHKDNLDAILSSFGGRLSYTAGVWKIRASVWEASSVTITENDIIDDVVVRGSAPRSERLNTVKGIFLDPDRKYEPVEFPHVSAASYITRDNGETLAYDLRLPMTNTETMAQRLAFRNLEQGNNQIVVDCTVNAMGAQVEIGDVVTLNLPTFGWDDSENLLQRSEQFDQWSELNATVTANTIEGPFGDSTADSFRESVGTGEHYVELNPAGTGNDDPTQVGTFSVFIKPVLRDRVELVVFNSAATTNSTRATFDLSTAQLVSTFAGNDGAIIDAQIENYPNGWFRISVTGAPDTLGGATDGLRPRIRGISGTASYAGSTSSGFELFGAQYEYGYAPTLYTRTTTTQISNSPKTFRCIDWKRKTNGSYGLTLREDDSGDYTDPIEADYTASANGGSTIPSAVVPAPSALAATSVPVGIQLDWTNPPSREHDYIDVYASATSAWSGASRIARVRADTYTHSLSGSTTRYYWVKAIRLPALESTRNPDSDTSTVSATSGGAPSADGVSVYTASVYKRAASAPSTPSGGSYNFGTTTLTAPTGWTEAVPAADGNPLYVSTNEFSVVGSTGTDSSPSWTSPVIFAQDGADGDSVYVATVYRRSATAPATPTVNDGSYDFGTNALTPPSGWTQAIPSGADPLYSSTGTFSISGATGTDSTVTWSAPSKIDNGGATIGDISDLTIANSDSPGPVVVEFRVNSDGDYYQSFGGSFTSQGTWIGNAANTDYQVKFTKVSGINPTGATLGSWLDTSTTRTITLTRPSAAGSGTNENVMDVSYRRKSDNQVIGTQQVTMSATIL